MSAVPGSYNASCQNIEFNQNSGGGGVLQARAQKLDGSFVSATLVYDVANMNGALTPLPSGSYQQSARNIYLENGSDGVYLVAEVQKINGSWVQSRLKLEDIANIDGTLKYGS